MNYKITHQHTYTFPETGESVTIFISDTEKAFRLGLGLNHTKPEKATWTGYFEGILQIQSKVNPKIWYIYLTDYWKGGILQIPTERVMMVRDCNA